MTSNLPPEAQFPAAKRKRGNPNWVKGRNVDRVKSPEPQPPAPEPSEPPSVIPLIGEEGPPPANTYPLGGDEARLAAQAEVLERRLRDPEGRPAPEITLKNPKQMPRWFNTLTNQGQRIWTAKEKGYIFVRREDVTDLDLLGLHGINADGAITRGLLSEQEVLMSIDRDMFHAIRRRKEAIESARFKSQAAIRSDLASSAAAKFGDEAGTSVHQMVGQILDTKDQEKL